MLSIRFFQLRSFAFRCQAHFLELFAHGFRKMSNRIGLSCLRPFFFEQLALTSRMILFAALGRAWDWGLEQPPLVDQGSNGPTDSNPAEACSRRPDGWWQRPLAPSSPREEQERQPVPLIQAFCLGTH